MARANTAETKQRISLFSGSSEIAGPRLAFIVAVFFLCVIGLVMVFSASSVEALSEGASPTAYFLRQGVSMIIGAVICYVLATKIPYDIWLGRVLDIFWLITISLLLLTAIIGTVALGAQRWLTLGGISGQPSELAKVAFVLMAARIMYNARTSEIDFGSFTFQMFVLVVLPLVILYFSQSDLGTTAICLVGILAVVFLSGANLTIIIALVGGLAAFGLAAIFLRGYRSDRLSFLNPEADYYGSGYQLVRSFYAFGEGGLFGVGLGNSSEKYLYLPEAETDFIFAIVGEELGLLGALAVVGAFLVILWAGLRIARNAPDLFGSMVAGGATVMLVFQAFLNIGCVTGILPTTGKPLPFISYGGSSLIGSFLLVGVILSVSFASEGAGAIYNHRRDNLRLVRGSGSSTAKQSASSKQKASSKSRSKGR